MIKKGFSYGVLGDGSKLQALFESKYENGIWTRPPVAFFSILTAGGLDDAPFISPDGKYLFFTKYTEGENEDFYWVDAKIIKELRPKTKIG